MNDFYQPDIIDRKILNILQEDGSTSHAALAEAVGSSTASCWRRVRALEEANVLGKQVRLINAAAIGLDVSVLCQVRLKSHEQRHRKEFEEFVLGRPEILECFSMAGEWDYLLQVIVASVGDYERFLMRELLAHPTVATASSQFALARVKYATAIPV